MKTAIAILTAATLLGAGVPKAQAGHDEWATAGKILTGLVIGGALATALQPAPVYHAPTVVYAPPPVAVAPVPVVAAPAPVMVVPAPVVVRPAPVVVYPAPVYCPAPVYRYAPVRYYAPGPRVSFHIGVGGGHRHYRHHPHRGW